MPHVFDIARVAALEQGVEVVVDGLSHQRGALGEGGAAQAVEAILIGLDFDDDQCDALGRREDGANFGDTHGSVLMTIAGRGLAYDPTRVSARNSPYPTPPDAL
jgi:hypothetical protein